jgi:hypothetical protein
MAGLKMPDIVAPKKQEEEAKTTTVETKEKAE